MSGHQYTQELLQGNNLQCTELIRMSRDSFVRLCNHFKEKNWLRDSKHISVEEKMFIFLMIIGHNERFSVMKRRFQHSKETIHNCFHEVLDKMLVFSEEVIRPTTFNPNPNIPGNNRRERRMFKGAVGALDGTLIHASVPSHKQNVYRARGRGDCYQNVLAICDFNMIFTYIVAGWEGTAHDARILNEALDDPLYEFPIPPSDKYYLCDAAYRHTRGFMAPYRNVRDYTIACFAIHNFIRKEGLSDDFFAEYDQSDIHVHENVRDDNDGDVEVAQPIGSEALNNI
ncbi:putative harbinger transposase-derived nuclease domain-containing protein [Tanacetum coccineum]